MPVLPPVRGLIAQHGVNGEGRPAGTPRRCRPWPGRAAKGVRPSRPRDPDRTG